VTNATKKFVNKVSETKAVGGYIVLQADRPSEAVEIARSMLPTLRYGVSVEARPILGGVSYIPMSSGTGSTRHRPSCRRTVGCGRRVKDFRLKIS
jgi:hypothetical protein